MKKPNILWILTDQQSQAMMSCMGNTYVSTPNIDYLARKGVLFEAAYCTNPVCLPSRFSLFTGLYPGDIGLRSNEFAKEVEKLPEDLIGRGLGHQLTAQGYRAVYGGKEHLPHMSARMLGFDYICSDEREELSFCLSDYIRHYEDDAPFAMVASFINPHDICLMAIGDFADEQKNPGDRWMMEHFKEARDNVVAAAQIPEGMDEDVFYECFCPPLPKNYQPSADEPEVIAVMQSHRDFKEKARALYTDRQWQLHRYAYDRLTEQADRQIGRLIKALKERGIWEDTVIIFTSDHGDLDAAHKMEHKTALYQECCKVPMVIKGLENTAGQRDGRMVCNGLDCIATVMDYAGLPVPSDRRGVSLKAAVELGDAAWQRDCVIVESEYGIMAVSSKDKYVCYDFGANREQYYDLSVNPWEQYNQIGESGYQDRVCQLKSYVWQHLKAQGR